MSVHPSLTYRDVAAATEFLERAFGLKAEHTPGGTALRYGSGVVLIQSERPEDLHGEHAGKAWVYVVVEDPEAHYEHARAEGAEVLGEVHDAFDGAQRGYSARDPEGNLWSFGTAAP
jgi:uncharacterized glyoxalase superfamily protein PhnB